MPEDHQPPKTSETVAMPQSPAQKRKEISDRIRLQAEQDVTDRSKPVSVARPTQDWTPTYRELLARASRQASALGSRDEDAINRMLERPNPDRPLDPSYRPPQEVIEDDARERELRAREAELTRREKELEIAELQAQIDRKRKTLDAPAPREESAERPPVVLPDTPIQRSYGDTDTTHWAGRKRMTAEERAAAEREGIELFGLDVTANSAWSSLRNLDAPAQAPGPPTAHQHRPTQLTEEQRLAAIAESRQRAAASAADPQRYAEALADGAVAEEAQVAPLSADEEYEARQKAAREIVDNYMRDQRGD